MEPHSCRACGLALRLEARFCDRCGARAPRAVAGEYKQVTVMFADVVRSMDIARTVGPERLGEIMAELVDRATDVVELHGGVVSQFTGDGVMAVFGAPFALENHALLACRAALGVCEQAREVAVGVRARDGVALHLRVGLNSGQVIAGEIGTRALGYTAIGEHVGLAQRMESVAPPDGVMLSESTAAQVEHAAVLGPPQAVPVKGQPHPVPVRRLLAVPDDPLTPRTHGEPALVGRAEVLASIAALLDRAVSGEGGAVRVAGPAGIGKTRVRREVTRMAVDRFVEVHTTQCESHTRGISGGAVANLLRSVFTVTGRDNATARSQVRKALAGAAEHDLLLLDDLLGIADATPVLSGISPEARQRRVAALVRRCLFDRATPTLYVIEDAHWIDAASESLFAGMAEAPATSASLQLITHRPEYSGALADLRGVVSIVLPPLAEGDTTALLSELLGTDPSLQALTHQIVETSSGNPFFVTEIVRDLAERGVLRGARGRYRCARPLADIPVPPTLQATVAARIDRLGSAAKSVLYAGAVIGMHFDTGLLEALVDESVPVATSLTELCDADFVEPAAELPAAGFAFCHPVVRTVAYESQLRATRTELHRRAAAKLAGEDPGKAHPNAALIAAHLHTAGDLRQAFDWHMRAGAWLNSRDRSAARASWQRARHAAAHLPEGDPERVSRLITALTKLCAEIWKTGGDLDETGFDELRILCTGSGDHRSLAIGTAGMILALAGQHRHHEANPLIADLTSLLGSIDDPALTPALLLALGYAKSEVGELREALHLAERASALATDPGVRSDVLFSRPAVAAIRMRGLYRLCLGMHGWRSDADTAIRMARGLDPMNHIISVVYKYILAVPVGARRVDDTALRETAEALEMAEQAGDGYTLTLARIVRGIALIHAGDPGQEAIELLSAAENFATSRRFTMNAASLVTPTLARHRARAGDLDSAIDLARTAITAMTDSGEMLSVGVATTVLAESLLRRGTSLDRDAALAAVERLAAIPTDDGFVFNRLATLRLRAAVAEYDGDTAAFSALRRQHAAACTAAGFDPPAD
ncbi:ATP-binding protein [Mycolicibacterium vaccae]|nr:adenylate/guanylate cyclase domain-containing protein [Mycolicibacterium vaccae]MCV7062091.1 AAA family ATPase [Mycolicibacterium vaccae]